MSPAAAGAAAAAATGVTVPGTLQPAFVLAGVTTTMVLTVALAAYSSRIARTTGDFYVAARSVPAWWNASAISGEYLSAAS